MTYTGKRRRVVASSDEEGSNGSDGPTVTSKPASASKSKAAKNITRDEGFATKKPKSDLNDNKTLKPPINEKAGENHEKHSSDRHFNNRTSGSR